MESKRVTICNRPYALAGGPAAIEAARVVDELMRTISAMESRLDKEQVAVLAAVHLASIMIAGDEVAA